MISPGLLTTGRALDSVSDGATPGVTSGVTSTSYLFPMNSECHRTDSFMVKLFLFDSVTWFKDSFTLKTTTATCNIVIPVMICITE